MSEKRKLTLYYRLAVRSIIADLLDVAKMNIAEEDAISSFPSSSSVVKRECDDVLHVFGVFEWFDGCIKVVFVRQVDTLKYGAFGVEKVAIIVTTAATIFSQHAVSTCTCTLLVAIVKTQLLTSAIVVFAHICSYEQTQFTMLSLHTLSQIIITHILCTLDYAIYASEHLNTLLSGPVEDLDVFELHPNVGSQGDRVCGVIFAAPLYGAISMCPVLQKTPKQHYRVDEACRTTYLYVQYEAYRSLQ